MCDLGTLLYGDVFFFEGLQSVSGRVQLHLPSISFDLSEIKQKIYGSPPEGSRCLPPVTWGQLCIDFLECFSSTIDTEPHADRNEAGTESDMRVAWCPFLLNT